MSKHDKKTEIAVVDEGNKGVALPQDFLSGMTDFADKSTAEFEAQDVITPSIRILQANSAQAKKSSPTYIEGAMEGHFLNIATNEIYDGGVGIIVIPCFWQRGWVEWKTRDEGGGLVKKWGKDETFKTQGYVEEKGKWVKKETRKQKDGRDLEVNVLEIIDTFDYYVLHVNVVTGIATPCVIFMSRTAVRKAKEWNSLIAATEICNPQGEAILNKAGQRIPGVKMPFWFMYRLTSIPQSDDQNTWYNYRIERYKPLFTMPNFPELGKQSAEFALFAQEGNVKTIEEGPEEETIDNDPNTI